MYLLPIQICGVGHSSPQPWILTDLNYPTASTEATHLFTHANVIQSVDDTPACTSSVKARIQKEGHVSNCTGSTIFYHLCVCVLTHVSKVRKSNDYFVSYTYTKA